MRIRFALPVILATGGLAAAAALAAPPPAILDKQAQERQVLAQIQEIDSQLDHTVDAFNGARIRLVQVERELRAERRALGVARTSFGKTQRRVALRLVDLYHADQPSTVEVLLGARNLGDLVTRVENVNAIAGEDHRLADEARKLRDDLATRERQLVGRRRDQRRTVGELDRTRRTIEGSLSERQRLLGSIRTDLARLEAEERARQARLAAEARARLEAEQRRLAAERAAAAQRAAQERAARAEAARQARPEAQRAAAAAAAPAATGGVAPAGGAPTAEAA